MPHPQLFFLLVFRKFCSDFLKWFPLFLHPVRDLYNLSIFHPMFHIIERGMAFYPLLVFSPQFMFIVGVLGKRPYSPFFFNFVFKSESTPKNFIFTPLHLCFFHTNSRFHLFGAIPKTHNLIFWGLFATSFSPSRIDGTITQISLQ